MNNYSEEILKNMNIVNEVLHEIKQPHLLKNIDFYIDEMTMETWLKISLKNNDVNKIPLSFTFTLTGLEVSIERVIEAMEWSNENIFSSRLLIKSMLKNILTSYILVEHYGTSRTRIFLFAQDGKCTNKFKYNTGVSFFGKRDYRLYLPIYDNQGNGNVSDCLG